MRQFVIISIFLNQIALVDASAAPGGSKGLSGFGLGNNDAVFSASCPPLTFRVSVLLRQRAIAVWHPDRQGRGDHRFDMVSVCAELIVCRLPVR